jgi:signal transduction histidine kinase
VRAEEAVEAALLLTAAEAKGRVTISVAIPSLPPALIARGDLTQVVANLLLNSIHSAAGTAEDPGRLTVAASHSGDGLLRLMVEDDGAGMAARESRRLFEPGFTTRPHLGAEGLGLTIGRFIAERAGGSLTLRPMSRGARAVLVVPAL